MAEQNSHYSRLKNVPESTWETIATQKLYFGHQSIGYNILNGIRDLMAENPLITLNIVETHDSADFETSLFAHSRIGENMYPQTKIDAFTQVMEDGIGEKVDVAFLKFCYIDFQDNTNIEDVFECYKESLSHLQEMFPAVIWIHFTVPVTSQQTGPKAWVKKMLGKPLRGYAYNITRNRFNALLRSEYEGKAPVFDLAKFESTFPNGKRASFTQDGTTYYTLVPEYTDDGSHLNEVGRKVIAEQFLLFLANTVE